MAIAAEALIGLWSVARERVVEARLLCGVGFGTLVEMAIGQVDDARRGPEKPAA